MQRSKELEDALRDYLAAISRGDLSSIEGMLARDADLLMIGTDPAEWWTGFDEAVRVFRTHIEEMGGSFFPFVTGHPHGYVNGDTGWVADEATLVLPGGQELPFRITSVYCREDGAWKLVQSHASFGVPNAESLGKELSA